MTRISSNGRNRYAALEKEHDFSPENFLADFLKHVRVRIFCLLLTLDFSAVRVTKADAFSKRAVRCVVVGDLERMRVRRRARGASGAPSPPRLQGVDLDNTRGCLKTNTSKPNSLRVLEEIGTRIIVS